MQTCNEHQTPTQVGVLLVFENEGVSEVATLPGDIGVPTDSFSSVGRKNRTRRFESSHPRQGCEAHTDQQASHKRKVVSSNLTAATKIWRCSCYRYVARAL